jgi:glc operon protein GlcG
MPLIHEGQVIGAIGVSGASSADEDQELATVGAAVAATFDEDGRKAAVFYAPSNQVTAKFETGGLLLDTPQYKVDAGRRQSPGEVEFHNWVTDIMYVLQGTATVVTGGEMVNSRQVKPGEIRAETIKGGATHQLAKGAVLVIPNGVPHQFTEVSKPFLYYVIKVEQ